jgi:hypothetical protein
MKGRNMIDISFEINGKKVNPDEIGDVIEKALFEQVIEIITKKVGMVRCPDHGTSPRIVCEGINLDNLSFMVYGCCDKLINSIKEKLV